MKLLMENWRQYEEYHDIFDNREYITEFLGIQLPLNESGYVIYTAELREQIIKEHLLLEDVLDSITKYIADKTAPMRDFMLLIYRSIKEKNPGLLKQLKINIFQNIIQPLQQSLMELLWKFKLKNIWEWIKANIDESLQMEQGLRGLLNWAGLAVFLRMAFKTLQDTIEAVLEKFSASGQVMDAIGAAAKEWFDKTFGDVWETIKTLAKKVVDIEKWIEMIGPIVGGVATVAKMLHPAVKGLAQKGATNTPEEAACKQACRSHSPQYSRAECGACRKKLAMSFDE
jgi:hypothetical protein